MEMEYSISEIFDIAIKIEKNGAKFYEAAAIICPEHAGYLQFLARQEREHLERFSRMRSDLKIQYHDEKNDFEDLDDQASLYLSTIADGLAFKNRESPRDELKGGESAKEILEIALEHEKETMLLYVSLRKYLPKQRDKDALDKIIEEETDHIVDLYKRLRGLDGNRDK